MSVSLVSKSADGNSGSKNQNGVRTRTETWLVVTTDPIDDESVIENAVDPYTGEFVPRRFDAWSGYVTGVEDTNLCVLSVTPRRNDDGLTWKVTVEYSTEARQDPIGLDLDFTSSVFDPKLTVQEYNGNTNKRALQFDKTGLAIRNSVGQAFDPPPEEEETITIRRITKNIRAVDFDDGIVPRFMGKVNSKAIPWLKISDPTAPGGQRQAQPYEVLMRDIRARREFVGHIEYYVVTHELHVWPISPDGDRGGWYTRILDSGFQKWKRTGVQDPNDALFNPYTDIETDTWGSRKLVPIEDYVYGWRLAQPALLDGIGQELRFAITALDLPCQALDTVLAVDRTAPIVRTDWPWLAIENEVVRVVSSVAGSPGVIKVLRGQKGTTKVAHAGGTQVSLRPVFLQFSTKETEDFNDLNLP